MRCTCRGERRLFLYELEFLTQYGVRPGTVVVYAGCAPGTRLTFLAELFPHIHFVLVDPVPLDVDESAVTNVSVRTEAFTDAIARELRAAATAEEKTLLFIANATADTQLGGQTTTTGKQEGGGCMRRAESGRVVAGCAAAAAGSRSPACLVRTL